MSAIDEWVMVNVRPQTRSELKGLMNCTERFETYDDLLVELAGEAVIDQESEPPRE